MKPLEDLAQRLEERRAPPPQPDRVSEVLAAAIAGHERVRAGLVGLVHRGLEARARCVPMPVLVGPEGTGKSTLCRALIAALSGGRESCIHLDPRLGRRELLGSPEQPGLLLRALASGYGALPVLVLEGLGRLSEEGAEALREGLFEPGPERRFFDRFVGRSLDVSRAVVIATASHPDRIPERLRSQIDVWVLPGYTPREKLAIARHFLHKEGLDEPEADDLTELVRAHADEAGVSHLLLAARKPSLPGVARSPARAQPTLGRTASALWPDRGPCTVQIEAASVEGRGKVELAAPAHDDLLQTVLLARQTVRVRAASLRVSTEKLLSRDLLLQVVGDSTAAGADLGLGITIALISLLVARPVRADVAMLGGITLHGRVRPVAGLLPRLLSLHRRGYRTILVPRDNVAELSALPSDFQGEVELVPVEHLAEAQVASLVDVIVPERDETLRLLGQY